MSLWALYVYMMPCLDSSYISYCGWSGPWWHLPQVLGSRACAAENSWRWWHAVQLPSEPSGFTRPIPVLGHVAASSLPSLSICVTPPWHCQQPFTAAADMPLGNCSVFIEAVLPSTTSASRLSTEPIMRSALPWWESRNSVASLLWHLRQSYGDTMTDRV